MTRPSTHILRLLRWGRILARHGALRGIERDPNTPPAVQRLCRIARAGTFQPAQPDYAGAFQAIGPAAIKLGQTLATRPDIVGEAAAENLLLLQDSLPPVSFALIRREIETSFGKPLEALFASIGDAARALRLVPLPGAPPGQARHLYCNRSVPAEVLEQLDRVLLER